MIPGLVHPFPARHFTLLDDARCVEWKKFSDSITLKAWIFRPNVPETTTLPCAVFFPNGWWAPSHPADFASYALHCMNRGIMAILAEYRTREYYELPAENSIQEGSHFLEWLNNNAQALGVDPSRIILAGGGFGGALALEATFQKNSPPPIALALFGPLLDTSPKHGVGLDWFSSPKIAKEISPITRIEKGLPPLFLLHGQRDLRVPAEQATRFAKRWKKKKNTLDMELMQAGDHRFYYFSSDSILFEYSIIKFDHFLVSQNLLLQDDSAQDMLLL